MDSAIKNTPNPFFKISEGSAVAKNTPTMDKINDGNITYPTPSLSNNLFFECVFNASKLIGKKAKRLALCAIFCSTPPKMVSRGMVTVPPPMPMPAGTPPKNPNAKYK